MSIIDRLDFKVPPALEQTLGYRGRTRWLALYYESDVGPISKDKQDLTIGSIESWQLFLQLLEQNFSVKQKLSGRHVDKSDCLLLDRRDRILYVGDRAFVEALLEQPQVQQMLLFMDQNKLRKIPQLKRIILWGGLLMAKWSKAVNDADKERLRIKLCNFIFSLGVGSLVAVVAALIYAIFYGFDTQDLIDKGVSKNLKHATQASTVEIAKADVSLAIRYAQTNPEVQGRLKRDSDLNQNFQRWVRNLHGIKQNLERDGDDATLESQTTALDQLRKSLFDSDGTWEESIKRPNFAQDATRTALPSFIYYVPSTVFVSCFVLLCFLWRETD